MDDLEITRLCAEAMGWRTKTEMGPVEGTFIYALREQKPKSEWFHYDPIHDDAQAMALVKKFHIHLDKTLRTPSDPFGLWIASNTDKWVSEPTSDLNRAICDCICKMMRNERG